ncbi:MAG: DNA glycosylase AlkZ-like family protein, partial [Thermoplasmata archaeon]
YYLNQGTIPEETDYKVYSERGSLIGSLSEKFVERLSQGDIFVLGGRSYEFIKSKGTKAFVKSASGRKPTVPSWTGELLPRSFDLSVLVGRFRQEMDERLGTMPEPELIRWLKEEFDVDEGSATTIVNYFKEQKAVAKVPTDSRLVIEGYVDASGNKSAIFHYPFGRRTNDALSRAYAHALSEKLKCNVTVSVTDDCFMLTVPRGFRLEDLGSMLKSADLERVLRSAIRGSELFTQRFRHTATRSFMVLRNYKGKELSVARQQLRSSRLLDALHELENFPVMAETYQEILTEVMDLEHATEVLASVERGERRVEYLPFSGVPSPFAHNVILVGVSDIVLMEDRSMLLRELHRKVLERVLGDEAVTGYQFDPDTVEEYFSAKFPKISSKNDIVEALRKVGPMNLFREKGESIYAHSQEPFDRLRSWASELLNEGKVRSVWAGEDLYVAAEDHALYSCLHRRQFTHSSNEDAVLDALSKSPMSQSELAELLLLSKEDLRDILRKLESANEIFRSGIRGESFCFSRSAVECRPRAECLAEAMARHIAYHAPTTVEDLAYEVGVSEPEAEEALRHLVSNEVVVSGRFVVGEQQQYMLTRDYLNLKSKGEPVFDRETVRSYAEKKQFAKVRSIREFFEKFGEAGMIYDIFQRVEGFDMEEFGELRKKGDILLGRFVRGRLRYVLAEDAPYYLGSYRRERLDKYEALLLRLVENMGSGTYLEIAEASGFPSDTMRDRFDSLDRKGYLLRLYDEAESWSSRNVYVACDVEPETRAPFQRVLSRYLRGFAPVTLLQTAAYLDVEPDEARALLKRVGARSIMVGIERTEMFVLPDELKELEAASPPDDTLRILSLYDSFLSDKWTEVTSRYGEGWIFPLVRRGRIVGMLEKWLLAGSVEIREIQMDEPELLGLLLRSLDDMMRFYNSLGVEIIRVRSVFGTEIASLSDEIKQEFIRHGYVESNGMLVKGRVVTQCFDSTEILGVVFSLQNSEESAKLRDMSEALVRLGGLRSDEEALLRVQSFEPLKRMHSRGAVLRGHLVPDRVGYCRMEEASLYRAARERELTGDERLVLRIIEDQQPVKRDRLLELSPLGRQDTVDSMKSLYASSRIYLDGSLSYVATRKRKLSKEAAWRTIIRRMLESYGIVTAESLGFLLGHEMPMRQIRRALRDLEDEGLIVKGYMLRGSGVLHWATVGAYEKLGKVNFESTLVLSPGDNLTQYLKASFRDLLPEAGRYSVFQGTRLVGSFWGKLKGNKLEVSDLRGEPECAEIVSAYSRRIGLALISRDEGRISDWEIMEFYQKSHPGMVGR